MVYNALMFTEAIEQLNKILEITDSDEVCDRIERLAQHPDLAMPSMMLLYFKVKGIDISTMNGVELANTRPTIADLILPPGVTSTS